MSLGEDLLLAAINPHGGAVRRADFIGFPLRASELVDLALARRIEVVDGRLWVVDPTWLDKRRLDETLVELGKAKHPPTLRQWSRDTPRGSAMILRYLEDLKRQGAVRLVRFGNGRSAKTGIILLDQARRDAVVERIRRVARGVPADEMALALAALVCSCRLSGDLGLGFIGRWRLERAVRFWREGRGAGDVVAEAKRSGIEAVVLSNPDRVALFADSMIDSAVGEYWRWRNGYEYDGVSTGARRTSGQGGVW